jgi:hypothetical protein
MPRIIDRFIVRSGWMRWAFTVLTYTPTGRIDKRPSLGVSHRRLHARSRPQLRLVLQRARRTILARWNLAGTTECRSQTAPVHRRSGSWCARAGLLPHRTSDGKPAAPNILAMGLWLAVLSRLRPIDTLALSPLAHSSDEVEPAARFQYAFESKSDECLRPDSRERLAPPVLPSMAPFVRRRPIGFERY